MKKKVVLFGAYDRYNYGDNLMPILLKLYLEKYEPEKLNNIELIFCSISRSDLSKYACFPTRSISDVVGELNQGDCVVVVGGEVLCASNATLFLHMPKSKLLNDFYIKLNRLPIINKLFKVWADMQYRTPWDYPYLPDDKMFTQGVSIKYNTVGGSLDFLPVDDKQNLDQRLSNADYISVRDKRTLNNLSHVKGVKLFPDSAFMMSDLCSEDFLVENAGADILAYIKKNYVVFQAAPSKLGASVEHLVDKLTALHLSTKKRVLLLPIGYAAGHDDLYLLNEVNKKIPQFTDIKSNLNVWEIMYLIKHADFYMGTSLHGVITAMSFGKPHFGINKSIQKLDAFLADWSTAPYNHCYSVTDIDGLPNLIDESNVVNVVSNAEKVILLVKENNERLFASK
jgi:exopolysaccharide biosynthesis predicted pyruvyltransferase EpsI